MKYPLLILALSGLMFSCSPIPKMEEAPPASGGNGSSAAASILIIPKPKPETVTIDWISPTALDVNIKNIGGKVEIKVRINSNAVITLNQIDILINGKPLEGAKAGEVNLLRKPELKEHVLTAAVPVTDGNNAIQVVISTGADKRYVAEQTIFKGISGIRVIGSNNNNQGATRIVWVKPDGFNTIKENDTYNTKSQEMEIQLSIITPDLLDKKNIKLIFNKTTRLPSPTAELRGSNGTYYFRDVITLNEAALINEVALRVESPGGSTESSKLRINYSPNKANLYVLAIGTKTNLKYTTKDARDFANLYAAQGKDAYRLFSSVTVDTLLGKKASAKNMQISFESLKTKLKTGTILEDDVLIVYISSHGFMLEGDLRIQGDDYDYNAPRATSVSYKNDILANIESLPCKKLLFIDACHGGGARSGSLKELNDELNKLKNTRQGLAVFASSRESEESHEDIKWQNGAFTEAVLKGLKDGVADANLNGIVTLNELNQYVIKEVPRMVMEVKNKPQNPVLTRNELGDFPIYVIKK